MILLTIDFPEILSAQCAIDQLDIPCVCFIGRDGFKIKFDLPLFAAEGVVKAWDEYKFNAIAPAYGGGDFTHNNFSKITLKRNMKNEYQINSLSLFYGACGWVDVIQDGDYCI